MRYCNHTDLGKHNLIPFEWTASHYDNIMILRIWWGRIISTQIDCSYSRFLSKANTNSML